MAWAVRYRLADSVILGIYSLPDAELALNYTPTREGMLPITEQHEIRMHPERWRVEGGRLSRLSEVTMIARPERFEADGVAECRVIFGGRIADATLFVSGEPHVLPLADAELILTSDVPRRFVLEIRDAVQWSQPLTVEAV